MAPPDPEPEPRSPVRPSAIDLPTLGVYGSGVALVVLWLLGATVWVPFPLGLVTFAFVAVMGAGAWLHRPRRSAPEQAVARRRLPLLLVLALPALASWVWGPFGTIASTIDGHGAAPAICFQGACLAASAALPLLLLSVMPGGRRFTLDIGALAFLATFLIVSLAVIDLSPGA